jgi:hypothetical protein
MQCPKCGKGLLMRTKRKGLLEKHVFWRLGRYPWECNLCKRRVQLTVREEPKTKPSPIWTG